MRFSHRDRVAQVVRAVPAVLRALAVIDSVIFRLRNLQRERKEKKLAPINYRSIHPRVGFVPSLSW